MNLQLLKKEIGGLRLVLWLIVAFYGIQFWYLAMTSFPDRQSVTGEEAGDAIASMVLFGILIGISLLGQEREHHTMPFLDGLPLQRSTLFFHKFAAACSVIAFVVLLMQSFGNFFYWCSSDSTSPGLSWWSIFAQSCVLFLLGYAIVGVATILSFWRKLFPLVAGLVLWGVIWVRSSGSWLSPWLDTGVLLRPFSSDSNDYIPWTPMIGHFVLGSLGWIGTLVGISYRDGFLSRKIDRMSDWRFTSWFVALGQLAAALVWILAVSSLNPNEEEVIVETVAAGKVETENNSNVENGVDGFGVYRSDYYEVIFRESQRFQVARVILGLDKIHEEVRQFFGNPNSSRAKIVLDTASPVMSHVSAQANWTKIRVPLALARDDLQFLRTVRHETAHVYIEQLSGGRARDHFNAMRMFHEGIASLVECGFSTESDVEFMADTQHRQEMDRWASGVAARGRVPFEILCDDAKLTTLRDPMVVYPLGYVVAQAMVDTGGPTLPRQFLEVLRSTPLPPSASPNQLWRILLQKCNTSLDILIANYESRLDALEERENLFLSALPRLSAVVSQENGEIVIRVSPTRSEAKQANLVCQIEVDRFITKLPELIPMEGEGEFRVKRSEISGNRIRFLVGWSVEGAVGLILEPWQEEILK
jgi:ABC-type transport system involved in multi-copper enzyme maturation permease subunit